MSTLGSHIGPAWVDLINLSSFTAVV